jgi:hypothetical protein
MAHTYFFNVVNIKNQNPPREITNAGVLRVFEFEDGTHKAEYFRGAKMGNFEFGGLVPTVSADFDGISVQKVANKMLDLIPNCSLQMK